MEAALDNQLQPVPGSALYEHPLNERIRTLLRLEYLFKQAAHHVKRNSHWDSRATLNCILEILAVFGNTNLKSEVMKELERHASSLKSLEQNPEIDHKQLSQLLGDIDARLDALHRINGQIASELKNSEFLSGIRQRSAIPGGTCDFDLPALHYWLGQFDAIGQSIQLILKLVRESTVMKPAVAEAGIYQKTMDPNLPCQLVRIALPAGVPYFAELSGGRHRFTARFLQFSAANQRASQTDQDVKFQLACCVI